MPPPLTDMYTKHSSIKGQINNNNVRGNNGVWGSIGWDCVRTVDASLYSHFSHHGTN